MFCFALIGPIDDGGDGDGDGGGELPYVDYFFLG